MRAALRVLGCLSLSGALLGACATPPQHPPADGAAAVDLALVPDGAAVDASAACLDAPPGPPAKDPYPFTLNGQMAWSHDPGHSAGWFHTYDALRVGEAQDLPHKVHVFLPRGYRGCDAGYPVVYFNDGGSTFFGEGVPGNKSWRVPDALAALYAAGAIPRVIAVGVVPVDRDFEYSHTPVGPNRSCCGAARYATYLADHVRGFIDRSYRTLREPTATAIVGSSRGGLASLYVATRRPDAFARVGSLSPSFWAGLDPVYGGTFPGGPLSGAILVTEVDGLLRDPARRPRLWIDWGLVRTGGFANSDIEAAATRRGQEMVALLRDKYGYRVGGDLLWLEDPSGGHDEDSWARRLPEVLKALLGR